ncbi:MerR family transcriptional regulator [Listeria monocytogenes]
MTDNDWLTVSEASKRVNIPVETIRRYLRSHNVHLRVKKLSKKYYIHDESLTVIEQIRTLYDRGKNVEEVEEALSASGIPMTITVKNDDDEAMTVHVVDELLEIKKKLEQQEKFNHELMKRLDDRDKYIKESLEARDQRLLEAIRESQQARLEVAASQEKKSFLQRLFNK